MTRKDYARRSITMDAIEEAAIDKRLPVSRSQGVNDIIGMWEIVSREHRQWWMTILTEEEMKLIILSSVGFIAGGPAHQMENWYKLLLAYIAQKRDESLREGEEVWSTLLYDLENCPDTARLMALYEACMRYVRGRRGARVTKELILDW